MLSQDPDLIAKLYGYAGRAAENNANSLVQLTISPTTIFSYRNFELLSAQWLHLRLEVKKPTLNNSATV